jgi:hypothetical protein
MTRATATIKINVTAAPSSGSLPALGAAKLVGAAGAHTAVAPNGMDTGRFTKALFEAYGSGAFVRDYSTDGAFVIAGAGGHNHYEVLGGAGFDFTSRSWFWRGVPGFTETGDPTNVSQTNGSPWYERTGLTQVPAPPHPYGDMIGVRAADAGNSKGSILHMGRAATCAESISSPTAHRFDCSTGVWARASTGQFSFGGFESSVVFDPVAKRFYSVSGTDQHARTSLPYLDVADWTFKTLSGIGYATPGSGSYAKAIYWAGGGKRLILFWWGTTMQALDLDAPTAGWRTLSISGAAINGGFNIPAWHQGNGNLYWRASSGAGNTLVKVVPPADPINGTWVGSTITLSGDAIPEFQGAVPVTEAYRSLFYIPSLNMLGWVTAFGVSLINPT